MCSHNGGRPGGEAGAALGGLSARHVFPLGQKGEGEREQNSVWRCFSFLSFGLFISLFLFSFLGGEGYSFICVCTGALFYIYSIEITHRKKSYIWNPCLFCFFFLPMVYCTSKSRTVQTDAIKRAIFSNKAESRATSYLGEAPRSFCNCKAESVTKALWTLDWMSKWLS